MSHFHKKSSYANAPQLYVVPSLHILLDFIMLLILGLPYNKSFRLSKKQTFYMIQYNTVGDRLKENAAPRRRKRGKKDEDGKEKMKATNYK